MNKKIGNEYVIDFDYLENSDDKNFTSFEQDDETNRLVKIIQNKEAPIKEKKEAKDLILQKNMRQINQYVNYLINRMGVSKRSDIREDAFQEACIQFLEMLNTYDSTKAPTPFLYAYKSIQRTVCKLPNQLDYGYSDHTIQVLKKVQVIVKKYEDKMITVTPEILMAELGCKIRTANHYLTLLSKGNQIYITDFTDDNRGISYVEEKNEYNEILIDGLHDEVMTMLEEMLPPINEFIVIHLMGIHCKKMTIEEIETALKKMKINKTKKEIQNILKKSISTIRNNNEFVELLKTVIDRN